MSAAFLLGLSFGFLIIACLRLALRLRQQRRTMSDWYGSLMMSALSVMRTGQEKRTYLTSAEHLGRVGRCCCAEYALPFPSTTLITDDVTHASLLCQPNREVIEEPSGR